MMKFLQYLYYKVFKTYNRIHKIIKLYRGPREQAAYFVSLFLFSIPLWITLKFKLWNTKMEIQFAMALLTIFTFIGLGFFVENKVLPGAISLYMNESRSQRIIGAILLNSFLMLYSFLWFYTLIETNK